MLNTIDKILMSDGMHYILLTGLIPVYSLIYHQTKLLYRICGKIDIILMKGLQDESKER